MTESSLVDLNTVPNDDRVLTGERKAISGVGLPGLPSYVAPRSTPPGEPLAPLPCWSDDLASLLSD